MPIYKGSKRIGVLSLGGKEIGKAYLGGVCVFNKEVVYEYDDPIVELTYPTISNTGGEYKPSYSYTQTARGSDGSVIKITSGGSLSWSIVNKASDVNFDTTTGEMACSVNSTDSDRLLGRVTLTVSLNGKTGSASYAIYQSAKEVVTEEYSTPSVSLSYGTASATATSLSPSYSYRQTKTTTYSDGSTTTSTITSGGSLSWSVSNRYSGATFSSSTGAFSFSANSTTSQITLGTVTLTVTLNGKSGSASATAYQAAGTITYSTPSVSLSYPTASGTRAGSITPTYSYSQIRYVNGVADGDPITTGGSLAWAISNSNAAEFSTSTGEIIYYANSSGSSRTLGVVTLTVTLNGETGSATATVYQAAGSVTTTYENPVITEFSYPTLGFKEGATAMPTIKFTQDWSDNAGNSGTLTEETTNYTAEFVAYSAGGDDVYFQLGENGEVVADSKNMSGYTNYCGSVSVSLTANGMTAGAASSIYQASRTAGVVDPVVNIDTTIFQEYASSGTKKVYFNIDTTMNSALSITPKYFLVNGEQYSVVTESVTHNNTSGSGTTTTQYWAELPYGGSAANYTFYLWCEFTFDTGEGERGYVYTDTDDVRSSNFLVIDSSGDFYVRS